MLERRTVASDEELGVRLDVCCEEHANVCNSNDDRTAQTPKKKFQFQLIKIFKS